MEAAFRNQKSTGFRAASAASRFTIVIPLLLTLLFPPGAAAQADGLNNRLEQAASLIRANRISEAEQHLNGILKSAPFDAQSLNLLGTIRASQGRLNEAEALFTRAVRSDKRMIGARMNLAYLYLLKGSPGKTISILKEVLGLDPDHTEALHKLTRLLLTQGRFDECISTIERSKQSETSVTLLIIRGDAYLKKGDADKAEESYVSALDKQSNAAEALLGMAQVSQLRGDVGKTSEYLSRSRAVAVNSPDLLYKFAVAAMKIGAYNDAKSALEQAIGLKADEPAYHIALGALWLKKPDLLEAEHAFRRALQLHPGSPQGQMYLGYALLKQKKYAEARAYLEKSSKSDSGIPEPFYYLGLIAQGQNEDERAVQILENVVQRFPEFANARVALGASYMKLKNYQRARQELELAVKLDPNEVKAHYNLAMLYARIKEPQRAQEEMQIVEKLKSSSAQAKDSDVFAPSPPTPR